MKKLISKLYILGSMAITVVLIIIIWKVTFGHIVEEYRTRQMNLEIAKLTDEQKKEEEEKVTFHKNILEGEERVKHYL